MVITKTIPVMVYKTRMASTGAAPGPHGETRKAWTPISVGR